MKDLITFFIKKSAFFKSLKFRIFIIIMLVGLLPCLILSELIFVNYEARAISEKTSQAINQCRILSNHLEAVGFFGDSQNTVILNELSQLSDMFAGRIMVIDQNFVVISDTYGMSEGKTIVSHEIIDCAIDAATNSKHDEKNHYIEIAFPITGVGSSDKVVGVMFASVSTDSIVDTLSVLRRKAGIMITTMSIIIFLISIALSTLLMRPFDRVTVAIDSVKEGLDYDVVTIPDYLETQSIMDAFNKLIERLKVLDSSRSEFVSNVSHELKTPLASMKVLADSIRGADDVPTQTYREFMDDIAEEVDRENEVINDLLSLVKMDKAAGAPNISLIDINSMSEHLLRRLKPIAENERVELIFESRRAVYAEVDRTKISLAIMNLVENAIKYNREGGWVRLTLDADHQFFTVEVADSGIGIPEESLEHIYERFYRVDKSHSQQIGGTGLGLSIARGAILLHRGAIKVVSSVGEGTTFVVRIPLKYSV